MKFFKGDELELKIYNAFRVVLEDLQVEKDELYDNLYDTRTLGDAIYETKSSPLTNAITQGVFRTFFNQLFEYFALVGTAEAYLSVFRKIFGDEVDVQFTVLGNGKLLIGIEASQVELSDYIARVIEGGAYVYYEIIDDEGDNIAFQTVVGLQSQSEVEKMLFEMVPQGVYTEITLTLNP